MKTTHDENKINDIINKFELDTEFYYGNTLYRIETAMQEYAEYIREKTIDECISCVPEKKIAHFEMGYGNIDAHVGHNTCREQTITNLNNLKNNERNN